MAKVMNVPSVLAIPLLNAAPVQRAKLRGVIVAPRLFSSSVQVGLLKNTRGCRNISLAALANDSTDEDGDSGLDSFRSALEGTQGEIPSAGEPMTGEELRELVTARWGRPYDTRITQRRNKMNQMKLYMQVMWKFLGQKSFPLSEKRYMEQLDAVADLLNEWGCADQVWVYQIRKEIPESKKNPVLDTTGANAVSFLLDVDVSDN